MKIGKQVSLIYGRNVTIVTVLLLCAVLFCLFWPQHSRSRDLKIISDEGRPTEVQFSPSRIGDKAKPTLANKTDKETCNGLLQQKELEMRRLEAGVLEEESLMESVVQVMDRETAANWASQFISSQPLNCSLKQQRQWINAILNGVERNRLPICKEIIGLTACIISLESGFHVDPLAFDPSKGENTSHLLERAENELFQKYGSLMSIPPVPQLYNLYKEKYYPSLVACRTEGEIESTRQSHS